MLITAIGMNEGFPGARRAGRYFPNGEEVRLEVVDQDDDPAPRPGETGPPRIGKKSYLALREDLRIKVISDDAQPGTISQASYEAARNEAAGLASEASRLRIENASLRTQVDQLKLRVAELERGAGEPAKGGEGTPPPAPEPAKEDQGKSELPAPAAGGRRR